MDNFLDSPQQLSQTMTQLSHCSNSRILGPGNRAFLGEQEERRYSEVCFVLGLM